MDVNNSSDASQSQTEDQTVNDQQAQPNLGAIRKAGEQNVLSVLSKVSGQQFSNTRDAAAFVESLLQGNNAGDAQPTKTQSNSRSNQGNSEMAELRNMIQGLQEQVALKDQAVRRTSLQSNIKDTAVKVGFDPNMLDIATGLFESQIDFDESGNYYVKGSNGSVKLDANGNPYTMEALAQDILRSRPKLAADEGRSGTGSKFGQGVGKNNNEIPDASTDLEGWKAWKERNGIGGKSLKGISVSVNKPLI